MRAFLIAFVCLSTLAMVQNVVVATPLVSAAELTISAIPEDSGPRLLPATSSHHSDAPRATTMMLLVVGLSGLCAVGGRHHDQSESERRSA